MKTSEHGKKLIKSFETLRLKAYLNERGVPVIGYGHKKGAYIGQIITGQEADRLLDRDIKEAERELCAYDRFYMFTQNEYDALISFVFSGGDLSDLTKEMTIKKRKIADAIKESALKEPDSAIRNRRALERYIFLMEGGAI